MLASRGIEAIIFFTFSNMIGPISPGAHQPPQLYCRAGGKRCWNFEKRTDFLLPNLCDGDSLMGPGDRAELVLAMEVLFFAPKFLNGGWESGSLSRIDASGGGFPSSRPTTR